MNTNGIIESLNDDADYWNFIELEVDINSDN